MVTEIKNIKKLYTDKIYNLKNKIKISFEVFPPGDIFLQKKLFKSIKILNQFNPEFFSVTNSTKINSFDQTFFIVKKIRELIHCTVFAHFTTIGCNELKIEKIAHRYWNHGIKNIIALRGDLPVLYSRKIIYAVDLIKLLNSINKFKIFVAAYPEGHPESKNIQEDLNNLRNKLDLGVKQAITQFFFNIDKFLKFRDTCFSLGLNVNLIPGILPILNFEQLKKFSNMTNVEVPKWILNTFHRHKNDEKKCISCSVYIIIDLIIKLYNEGITHFHLYTLNQPHLISLICQRLGLV
ncbi:methylenetetrahydrofolate reductase [Buchnera aphidicola]|uniref:Methylenetetrahydrofolate reductase n=1 Tax=Buchnera aphidicola subsp. Cinara cedri (strain Cc) TaxID=372461 RepID=Q058D8_BUCCC|nr:methylenetetrahydrofolate reductase [Buchnera aphidicola]ABJ90511.1 5,10-methylenetetrahydrofolate reductase [Buchnera aphidicola BCc]